MDSKVLSQSTAAILGQVSSLAEGISGLRWGQHLCKGGERLSPATWHCAGEAIFDTESPGDREVFETRGPY